MANEDSVILKEVDQALDEDRTWDFFRKNGAALIGAAVLIVGGVAGWQLYGHMRKEAAQRDALQFQSAVELHQENREAGRTALAAVAEEKSGFSTLANLRRAASYAAGGERLKALEIYREIADSAAPRRIRELARLRAGYLALADGRDAVMGDLDGLEQGDGPFSFYAKEILGIASLNAKDYESAAATFDELKLDLSAPLGVRERAEEFAALAASGKAGVNLTGEAQLDDLLRAVGNSGSGETPADDGDAVPDMTDDALIGDDTVEDDHSDHNHEE